MKERPILFSAPMVRAILEGRKTQTRRVVSSHQNADYWLNIGGLWRPKGENLKADQKMKLVHCPYGQVGDQLWVREAFNYSTEEEIHPSERPNPKKERSGYISNHLFYRADGITHHPDFGKARWKPSIHMPRWASRIQLEITGIRVERLQDISEEDAKAEGLKGITKDGNLIKYGIPDADGFPGSDNTGWEWCEWHKDPRFAFCKLWTSINGVESWNSNPFVWVVEFKRAQK